MWGLFSPGPAHTYPGHTVEETLVDHTNAFSILRRDVDDLDEIIRGDGNGKPGLAARVRILETRDPEVRRMIQEWDTAKAEMRGAKKTAIVVGVILTVLGGGLGAAILSAISQVAAAIP